MDWNAKWDWENLGLFNLKTFESPKHQTTDWEIEKGEGIMDVMPFHLCEGKGSGSGFELAPGSLARSSVSVCTDYSSKEVMEKAQVAFGIVHAFSGDFRNKEDLGRAEQDELSSPLESSVGSGESLIGLKLGKRIYFENNSIGGSTKTASLPGVPCSSVTSTVKKIKSLNSNETSCCQVEGCSLDLSSAKEYYRKQKVCANHSKCPKVVVGGVERRFCQKCSRFHSLSEFDEKKRSCRRQLSSHNVRRRKPQRDSIGLPSPFSDSSSKFTTTKRCLLQFGKTEGFDEQLQLTGFKESIFAPNFDSAPDFHHALCLLSNNSLGSYPPSNNSLDHSMNVDHMHHEPLMQGFPQTFSQTSSEFCETDHHSTNNLPTTANASGHFQLFKAPKEDALYSILFN